MISTLQTVWQLRSWRDLLQRAVVSYLAELNVSRQEGFVTRHRGVTDLNKELKEAEKCLTWLREIE